MKRTEVAIMPLVAIMVAGVVYLERAETPQLSRSTPGVPVEVPDFASIKNVHQKKQRFFEFMLPMVRKANERVLSERKMVAAIADKMLSGGPLTDDESARLADLMEKYKIDVDDPSLSHVTRLLRRVDTVPASQILAQSANESGWGTSRFAREGNNFFGIWCFTQGCGLTPRYRDDGLTHEVARFETVQESVDHYLFTINTNPAYRDLREIRTNRRKQNKGIGGLDLAEGLIRYSERGRAYVREIQAMIRFNELQRYTREDQA